MSEPAAGDTRDDPLADRLAELADDFLHRHRAGEHPSPEEYCRRHPDLADRIRDLFPAVLAMERPDLVAALDPAPPAERIGATVGRYKLLARIGEGGFGVVYMAEQQHPVRRRVALKVIKPGMDSAQVIARFEAERQALAMMDHHNIAKVFDAGATDSGRPYFVMELVDGELITEFCDRNHLPPRQRLELFVQVCHAVQHAHQKGIIHRDLKPGNVLVAVHDNTPVVKVIDFGVAKALAQEVTERTQFTGSAQLVGTPLYMSPEQAGRSPLDVDTRSDIYSLGVLLYELLTGTTPFDKERFSKAAHEEIRRIIREEEPPKPSTRLSESKDALASISALRHMEPARLTKLVRGELDWIVMKALEKDRARRYDTANGLASDVRRYLADEPVLACAPTAGYRLRKLARRHRRAVLSLSTILAILVVGTVVSTWQALRATAAIRELEVANRRERQRFDLAMEAIGKFHTGASEDVLLKEPQFKGLRDRLLKDAADFYRKLEALLGDQPDTRSRRALAKAYAGLGWLISTVGSKEEALAAHRRALEVRRTLAAPPGADAEVCLELGHSLNDVATIQCESGRLDDALASFEEARRVLEEVARTQPGHTAARLALATSHSGIGVVLWQRGRYPEALAAYERAHDIRKALADAHPGVPSYRSHLAHAHINIAGALGMNGRFADALAAYERARDAYEALAEAYPDQPEYLLGVGQAYQGIGYATSKQAGMTEDQLRAYGKARDALQQAAKLRPAVTDYKMRLADTHNSLANAMWRAGRYPETLAEYDNALELNKAIAGAHPNVPAYRAALALNYHNSAGALMRIGRRGEALTALQKAQDAREWLVKVQPDVPLYKSDLAETLNRVGRLSTRAGNPAEAMAAHERARDLYEGLVKAYPDSPDYQIEVACSLIHVADLLAQAGKPAEGLRVLGHAQDICETLARARPHVARYKAELAWTLSQTGVCLLACGRNHEALTALQRCRETISSLRASKPTNNGWQGLLAACELGMAQVYARAGRRPEALEALGRAEETVSVISKETEGVSPDPGDYRFAAAAAVRASVLGDDPSSPERAKEADRALELLRKAIAGGDRNLNNFRTDPALDALRGRDDFKKLLADLEATAPTFGMQPDDAVRP